MATTDGAATGAAPQAVPATPSADTGAAAGAAADATAAAIDTPVSAAADATAAVNGVAAASGEPPAGAIDTPAAAVAAAAGTDTAAAAGAGTAEAGAAPVPLRSPVSTEGMVPFLEAEEGFTEDPWEPIATHEQYFIDLRKLSVGQKFASGTYGQLFRGVYDGLEVAVKLLKQPSTEAEADAANGQDLEHQCRQEVDMLSRLQHPNVLRLVGACQRPPQWCIITEFMSGGDLRGFLSKQEGRALPLADVLNLALEIARGMDYLHEKGIVHRDLKPDNLLLAGDKKTLVVSDFGVSRIEASAVMTAETGTYRWMAPEMIDHKPYTRKVDVYSFAIVLWELYTVQLPFAGMTAMQAAFAVVNKGARPQMPKECPAPLSDLIQACWHCDPDQRPTFATVVKRLEDMAASFKADPEAFLAAVAGSERGFGRSLSLSRGSEKGGGARSAGGAPAKSKTKGGGFLCCFGGGSG